MNRILSIIVPSYNMEKYLPKCLGSMVVAPELMARLEVLVVNDGSQDRTSEIAHDFAAKWPGTFRVIDKENGNYGSCVERGLAEATGAYVKTIDADDWVLNENFADYLRFVGDRADADDAPDLVLNDFEFVGADLKPYRRMSYAFCDEPGFTVADFTFEDEDHALWMHAVAYRTENLRKIAYTQMHGISYTDEEWISLPVTTVRTIARYPKVVYAYFTGREGQTCQYDVYLKSFWMQIAVLRKMISQYVERRGQWGPDQERYMCNHLLYRLRLTYCVCLSNRLPLNGESLSDFDAFLKKTSPQLYRMSEDCVLFRHCPLRLIAIWRRCRHLASALVWLCLVHGRIKRRFLKFAPRRVVL